VHGGSDLLPEIKKKKSPLWQLIFPWLHFATAISSLNPEKAAGAPLPRNRFI
jgi:hypothetical protein